MFLNQSIRLKMGSFKLNKHIDFVDFVDNVNKINVINVIFIFKE